MVRVQTFFGGYVTLLDRDLSFDDLLLTFSQKLRKALGISWSAAVFSLSSKNLRGSNTPLPRRRLRERKRVDNIAYPIIVEELWVVSQHLLHADPFHDHPSSALEGLFQQPLEILVVRIASSSQSVHLPLQGHAIQATSGVVVRETTHSSVGFRRRLKHNTRY